MTSTARLRLTDLPRLRLALFADLDARNLLAVRRVAARIPQTVPGALQGRRDKHEAPSLAGDEASTTTSLKGAV